MKRNITTDQAPAAIGPYSQGIVVNDLLFTSGQLPIDIKTGMMPTTIEEQTIASLSNVKAIVEAAGSGMKDVIKVMVFLKDMNDFVAMNQVYETFFEAPYPSRSCVEVARLPKDANIEIEAIVQVKNE
ncbi:MAG: reactive intermediate/imine deaminase [Firmicutes bacterium HGW-Firmicutes-2]|jgi:2-iminobutanoate/2-iminopropanoate deaminase|nr:MAG: reactive intermediate/imine deaminase [Firmicutes bacterium HGW-Firmicutes-2]